MNTELQFSGIKYDDNPNDFIIRSDSGIDIPQNYNTLKFFYNQGKQARTRNACGIYASLGTISDYIGYEFSDEEILECVDRAEKNYGWQEDGGMYMSKAVDCARNYWNEKFPEQKLMTIRSVIGDDTYKQALHKGHTMSVGYRTSLGYYYDSQDDGNIDEENYELNGGGHLVRMTKDKGNILIRDNYYGIKKYNSYENNKIEILYKNGVYFPSAYIFFYEDQQLVDELREERVQEIISKIAIMDEKGEKRIPIYLTLKNFGYSERNILIAMRKFYDMNITEEM